MWVVLELGYKASPSSDLSRRSSQIYKVGSLSVISFTYYDTNWCTDNNKGPEDIKQKVLLLFNINNRWNCTQLYLHMYKLLPFHWSMDFRETTSFMWLLLLLVVVFKITTVLSCQYWATSWCLNIPLDVILITEH